MEQVRIFKVASEIWLETIRRPYRRRGRNNVDNLRRILERGLKKILKKKDKDITYIEDKMAVIGAKNKTRENV